MNPFIEDDSISQSKQLLIEMHNDWEYSQNHFSEMLQVRASKPTTLDHVLAEASIYGVVVHYQQSGSVQRLLWTGDSIRGFSLIEILEDGTILLKKNRSIVVLQLMRSKNAYTDSKM